jgi:putative transposase
MSYIKIMVHAVWGTKNRQPVLSTDKRSLLFDHIKSNSKEKEIYLDCISGYTNHVHCLISLGVDQNIAKVMQLLKGESSYWSNKEGILSQKLIWADEFFAASVSQSAIPKVRAYIQNQEEHHRTETFQQEYERFIAGHGLKLS